jgi:hypothetical protein
VLDEDGVIMFVNKAWCQFAEANGLAWDDYGVGRSYLEVCDVADGDNAIESRAALNGIHGVLTNQQDDYSLAYPCHSNDEQRWFFMYVFRYEDNCKVHIAVVHMNISGQMLAEGKLQNFHGTL